MLAVAPTCSAPTAALPDYLLNAFRAFVTAALTYEAVPNAPYVAFVNTQGQRIAYSIEIGIAAVI